MEDCRVRRASGAVFVSAMPESHEEDQRENALDAQRDAGNRGDQCPEFTDVSKPICVGPSLAKGSQSNAVPIAMKDTKPMTTSCAGFEFAAISRRRGTG